MNHFYCFLLPVASRFAKCAHQSQHFADSRVLAPSIKSLELEVAASEEKPSNIFISQNEL